MLYKLLTICNVTRGKDIHALENFFFTFDRAHVPYFLAHSFQTRWHPRGIQKLVSTYDLHDCSSVGEGILGKSKLKILKVPRYA